MERISDNALHRLHQHKTTWHPRTHLKKNMMVRDTDSNIYTATFWETHEGEMLQLMYEPWINTWHFILSMKRSGMIYNLSVKNCRANHRALKFWICYHASSAGSISRVRQVCHVMLSEHMIEYFFSPCEVLITWSHVDVPQPAATIEKERLTLSIKVTRRSAKAACCKDLSQPSGRSKRRFIYFCV